MRHPSVPRRTATAAALSVGLTFTAAACSSSSGSSGSSGSNTGGSGRTFTIGVAEADTTISFLAALDKSVQNEATKLGMKTVILDGHLDNATQAANVQTLVAKRVDLILVVSSSPTAVVSAVNQAKAAGIPVMALNAQLDPAAKVVTYIGDSDFQYGAGEGKLLVQALPKGGKIAVILGPLGDTPEVQRLAGIKSVLKDHPDISIVATPTDGFDNSKNLSVTQDLLAKYPRGTLNAIVAEGPEMYVGANYAQKTGRTDIAFVAGDYSFQVQTAIQSGALYGTVNQSPVLEGKLGADYAHDWLNGKQVLVPQPTALIPLPLITRANVGTDPAEWSG